MNQLKSLKYFCSSLIDPMYELFQVLDNDNHSEHQNVLSDIRSLDSYDLTRFVEKNHIDEQIGENEDKETARRAHFLVNLLQYQINVQRKEKLTEATERQAPYDSSNFLDIDINGNQLVKMDVFDLSNRSLKLNEMVYVICPSTEASKSSYWLSQVILKLKLLKKINFKIRLDPLKEIHKDQYNPIMYKMLVHGKPLDWNKLRILEFDDFGQWFNEKDYN